VVGVHGILPVHSIVNTKYGAGRVIYPDFASGFAAIFLSSIRIRVSY
jgi:hypothetical protein